MAFGHAGFYGTDTLTGPGGVPLPAGTLVTVYDAGTDDEATLYADRDRAVGVNPVPLTRIGNLTFYADPGRYDLAVAGVTARIRVAAQPDIADLDGIGAPLDGIYGAVDVPPEVDGPTIRFDVAAAAPAVTYTLYDDDPDDPTTAIEVLLPDIALNQTMLLVLAVNVPEPGLPVTWLDHNGNSIPIDQLGAEAVVHTDGAIILVSHLFDEGDHGYFYRVLFPADPVAAPPAAAGIFGATSVAPTHNGDDIVFEIAAADPAAIYTLVDVDPPADPNAVEIRLPDLAAEQTMLIVPTVVGATGQGLPINWRDPTGASIAVTPLGTSPYYVTEAFSMLLVGRLAAGIDAYVVRQLFPLDTAGLLTQDQADLLYATWDQFIAEQDLRTAQADVIDDRLDDIEAELPTKASQQDIADAVEVEAQDRNSADVALSTGIQTEIDDRTESFDGLNTLMNDEIAARIAAEALLIPLTQKGAPDGVASLDPGGKVFVNQLPNSIMQYQGTWNVATNTPTLVDGAGSIGDVYRVTTGGTRNLGSGAITFDVGDYAVLNASSVWEKSDTTDSVPSWNSRTGNVLPADADYTAGQVTFTPSGLIVITGAAIRVQTALAEVDAALVADRARLTAIEANNWATNARLADVPTATMKGRITAGTGDPEDLTAVQARTLLSVSQTSEVLLRSLLTANTVAAVQNDGTIVALAVPASRVVGRKATGDIVAMTGPETRAITGSSSARSKTIGIDPGAWSGTSSTQADNRMYLFEVEAPDQDVTIAKLWCNFTALGGTVGTVCLQIWRLDTAVLLGSTGLVTPVTGMASYAVASFTFPAGVVPVLGIGVSNFTGKTLTAPATSAVSVRGSGLPLYGAHNAALDPSVLPASGTFQRLPGVLATA